MKGQLLTMYTKLQCPPEISSRLARGEAMSDKDIKTYLRVLEQKANQIMQQYLLQSGRKSFNADFRGLSAAERLEDGTCWCDATKLALVFGAVNCCLHMQAVPLQWSKVIAV